MSIRAEILDLLDDLVVSHRVRVLYITHDLLSARKIPDHALVLSKGRVVESGDAQEVIDHPKDDYNPAAAGRDPAAGSAGRSALIRRHPGAPCQVMTADREESRP